MAEIFKVKLLTTKFNYATKFSKDTIVEVRYGTFIDNDDKRTVLRLVDDPTIILDEDDYEAVFDSQLDNFLKELNER
jgi:hypothetical protein